jgi:hypothetical protein
LQNPDSNLLCLAHANGLVSGKGSGMKSPDIFGAILCDKCHKNVDFGNWTREKKREFHQKAAAKTRAWWIMIGLVK